MNLPINKVGYLFLCFILIDTAWATGPPYILHVQATLCSSLVLPSGDDISAQEKGSLRRFERFNRESIEPRLAWEYRDCFFDPKDAEKLSELAKQAGLDLEKIYLAQEVMRKRIEDYEGDDWERLYGQTGLWRKVCVDAQRTRLMKAQVDYYAALTAEPEKKRQILQDVIDVCKLSEPAFRLTAGLLKARALGLMARGERVFKEKAIAELESILSAKDLTDEARFAAELEKIKTAQNPEAGQTEDLAGRFRRSKCADDFELNLKLAFLALRFSETGLLGHLIAGWPEAEGFVGSVILSRIAQRLAGRTAGAPDGENLSDITVFEVELAAGAAGEKQAEKHEEILSQLCKIERFQTPLLFYVTAETLSESAPVEAVEYYRLSALAQHKQKSKNLELEAVEIAEKGVQLAHRVYYERPAERQIALNMAGFYCALAGDGVDETIQYIYSCWLSDEGQSSKANELLEQIARGTGKYASQARLDLIVQALKEDPNDLQLRYEMTKKLKSLIDSPDFQAEHDRTVKAEAVDLYCQFLLENDDKTSAQEVLRLIEGTEGMSIQRSHILRAAALKKLGRFWAAVNELLTAAKFDNCEYAIEGLDVLRAILGNRIDEDTSYMSDFMLYIDACDRLAEHCLVCAQPGWQVQAGLIRAEVAILCPRKNLAGEDNNENLDKAERILSKLSAPRLDTDIDTDIDWLRCRARFLMAKNQFSDAARAWGQVRAANKSQTGKKSWKWWRAKFYEIQCWSRVSDTTDTDVAHAVEVLQNSCTDIPPFWARKFQALKAAVER